MLAAHTLSSSKRSPSFRPDGGGIVAVGLGSFDCALVDVAVGVCVDVAVEATVAVAVSVGIRVGVGVNVPTT